MRGSPHLTANCVLSSLGSDHGVGKFGRGFIRHERQQMIESHAPLRRLRRLHLPGRCAKGALQSGGLPSDTLTDPGRSKWGIGWTLAGEVSPAGDFVVWQGRHDFPGLSAHMR